MPWAYTQSTPSRKGNDVWVWNFHLWISCGFMVLKNKLTTAERVDHILGWWQCSFAQGGHCLGWCGKALENWIARAWTLQGLGVSRRVQQVASVTPPCLRCLTCLCFIVIVMPAGLRDSEGSAEPHVLARELADLQTSPRFRLPTCKRAKSSLRFGKD